MVCYIYNKPFFMILTKEIEIRIAGNVGQYYKKNNIDVKFMAEPGRFFVTSAYTLVTSVINKKIVKNIDDNNSKHIIYYLSESVYGSFNNIVF